MEVRGARGRRGGFRTRPYIRPDNGIRDNDNPMHMIRHLNKRIQFNIGNVIHQIFPCELDQSAKFVQLHFIVHDFAK